jgi:hypothetical protein
MKGRKTGGRLKGTCNKATVEIKELARRYALIAVRELARLATNAQPSKRASPRSRKYLTEAMVGLERQARNRTHPSKREDLTGSCR